MGSIKQKSEAISILKDYKGKNPYILMLKRDVYVNNNISAIGDFQAEYILKNKDREPRQINKVISITKWYGEKKQVDWNTEFIPEKIKIITFLGETQTTFNCYVKYRQSEDPVMCFIPKSAVINDFLSEDYHNMNIDFDRYDRLSSEKDPDRHILPHQKEAVKFLISRRKCILADEQGLGKSLELSVASIEGNFDSVIIICPASLKEQWKRELSFYAPERDITIIEGFNGKKKGELEKYLGYAEGKSGLKREELLEEAKNRGKWQDNRFVIVNFDILDEFYKIPSSWSQKSIDEAYANSSMLQYIKNKKSLIVVDEAHRLSEKGSIRYKVIKDLIRRGEPDSIYLATGTPITNNPQNLYYVLHLIENTVTADYKYYTEVYCGAQTFFRKGERDKWTNIFLNKVGKSSWMELSKKEKDNLKDFLDRNAKKITVAKDATNLDELKSKISHIYLRRTKSDIGDMPEKHINEVLYELSNEQRIKYESLWDEYEREKLEEDPDKELNKELIEGSIYRGYLSEQMVPYTEKMVDKLIEQGEKVVIACCFDNELYALKEYYGERCVIYNGKMNLQEKEKAIKAFMNEDDKKVFIGNIIAAGVGITLTKSCNLIFNSFDYAYVNNAQMEDRIHRIGQKRECNVYYQIFKDTQAEKVWEISARKEGIFNNVIKKERDK